MLRLSERCVPVCLPASNSQLPDLGDAIFKHLLSYHCGGLFFTASATRNDFVPLISPPALRPGLFKSPPNYFKRFAPLSPPFSEGIPPPRARWGGLTTQLNWQGNSVVVPPLKGSSRLGQPPGTDKPAEGCPGRSDGAGEAAALRSA